MSALTAPLAAKLREPFGKQEIGKLPRVYCKACRESASKNCQQHPKIRCEVCRNTITSAHLHLDYVGHAEVTDRLLQVDPEWSWEPCALSHDGIPFLDNYGGLWIKLTVAGVTRLGYGHADGKKSGDGIKETIGDALRNAAMRFGVALDLWGAIFEAELKEAETAHAAVEPPPAPAEVVEAGGWPDTAAPPPPATQEQHKRMHLLWRDLGYTGPENREQRLKATALVLKLTAPLASSKELTGPQAEKVIAALKARRDDLLARKQEGAEA